MTSMVRDRRCSTTAAIVLAGFNQDPLLDLDQARRPLVSMVGLSTQEVAMRKIGIRQAVLASAVFAVGWFASPGWSPGEGPSLAVESAQARVGRPLTPVSVAGVARRHTRRAVYGAGVVGAGAAAVGTAAAIGTAGAVAATSPNWGWGGNPYQTGTGYYAGGPYYGGSVRGARAAYDGGYPSAAWGGVSSSDRAQYIKNLHDSGYNPKDNFNANGTVKTQ